MSESEDKKLGMDRSITRRDFLNGVAIGSSGAFAESMLPSFARNALALVNDLGQLAIGQLDVVLESALSAEVEV